MPRPAPGLWEVWLKTIPAMMHSIDANGRLIFVSDLWLSKLGYSRADVTGRPSTDFLTLASREHAIRNVLPAFFRTGHCENVEYQMVAKDGRVLDVLLTSNLYRSPLSEKESWSFAVMTDVTELKIARQLLNEHETIYRSMIEDQPELVSLISADGTFRFANNALAHYLGVNSSDLPGRSIYDFLAPSEHAEAFTRLEKLRAGTVLVKGESKLRTCDNETRWVSWTHRAIRDANGCLTSVDSVGRDVEERVMKEKHLQDSEARYRLLAENSTDMVIQINRDGLYTYVSPGSRDLLGCEPDDIAGLRIGNLAHPEDTARIKECFQALLDGKSRRQQMTGRIRHRDGRWIWSEGSFRVVIDPETGEITGLTGAIRDISARKTVEDKLAKANQRLAELATTDDLTGLNNRRGFNRSLAAEYRRAKRDRTPLSLIMIDADHFKLFNDRYGHLAGDMCLRKMGECIKHAIHRPGDLAVRYGGEEMAILLPGTSEEGGLIIAEKIREDILRLAIPHADSPWGVMTISAGIATAEPRMSGLEPSHLIGDADRALYHAKANKRNKCVPVSRLFAQGAVPKEAPVPA